jgi:hypothetical protein
MVMKVKHKQLPVKKIIWRMSDHAPLGEYLSGSESNALSEATAASNVELITQSSWKLSSVDLLDGLQVSEQPMETLPGELLDEFFKR